MTEHREKTNRSGKQLLEMTYNTRTPTALTVSLNKKTVDYLLSLAEAGEDRSASAEILLRSIRDHGWYPLSTMAVSQEGKLVNGRLRLQALRRLDYPKKCTANIVFGLPREAVVLIDRHRVRDEYEALRVAGLGTCEPCQFQTMALDLMCNRVTLEFSRTPPNLEKIVAFYPRWKKLFSQLPVLLQESRSCGGFLRFTPGMILAVADYRRFRGLKSADRFLREMLSLSQEHWGSAARKAALYCLQSTKENRNDEKDYRTFSWLLQAFDEGRMNPPVRMADNWGKLNGKTVTFKPSANVRDDSLVYGSVRSSYVS